MKEYDFSNINEFYEEMNNSLNPTLRKFSVWAGWVRDTERREKEEKIEKLFRYSPLNQYHATVISDDIAIVQFDKKGVTQGYFTAVNNEPIYILWDTFDQALLCALSIKYTGGAEPVEYAMKIMDM